MSSIDVGKYKNTNVENPREGYRKPSIVTAKILVLAFQCALLIAVNSKIIFCGNLTFKLHFKACKSIHDEFPIDLG
jgi:hypothetical protein